MRKVTQLLTLLLLLAATAVQAQWWPNQYFKQGTYLSKGADETRSDLVMTTRVPNSYDWRTVAARLAVYEKMISLRTYGTYEVFQVEQGIDPMGIVAVGPSAHMVDVQSDSLGNLLFAVRFTDSLYVGDSLLASADSWSPEELLVSYNIQDSTVQWVRPVFGVEDLL